MTQPPVPPGPPPPGPPPQGPPPQGPPPQGQQGHLVLTLQGNALTSNMVSPTVTLNGYPVPSSYGENRLPVTPGRIHVAVQNQWMRTFGQAAIDVDVHPGQSVHLWYATPWHQFSTGSIGYEKQKRKGGGTFLGIMALVLLVPTLIVLLSLL